MPYLCVSEVVAELQAQGIACTPKIISDMLYRRQLDVGRCPLLAGRRLVPHDYVGEIASLVKRRYAI